MPGYSSTPPLAPFPHAVTKSDIQDSDAISDPTFITSHLVSLSEYLVDIVNHTTMFGPSVSDPYQPSLSTLYTRLKTGIPSLTPLNAIAKSASRLHKLIDVRVDVEFLLRPLEDFEDLFYALLARMQEMLHILNMRITSGFNTPFDTLFPSGPTISDWHASMTAYWETLNDSAFAHTLDDAVRRGRVCRLYEEVVLRLECDEITHEQAETFLEELYAEQHATEGMTFIQNWEPLHVGLELEQKYRTLMRVEKEEDARKARERRRSVVPRKEMRVKKTRGKSATVKSLRKRGSVEKTLKGVQGSGVQHVDKDMRIVEQHANVNDQDRSPQDATHHDHPWQAKHQRVSDYSNYLRVRASHTARSGYTDSTYHGLPFGNMLKGDTLVNGPDADKMGKDEDMMRF